MLYGIHGIVAIRTHDSSGEYINLNQDTGEIFFGLSAGETVLHCTYSVAQAVRNRITDKGELWFAEPFERWKKEFSKTYPNQYDYLINM